VTVRYASRLPETDFQLPVWNALYQVRDFAQYVNRVRAGDSFGGELPLRKVDKTTWRVGSDPARRARLNIKVFPGVAVPEEIFLDYDVMCDLPGPFGAQVNDDHAFLNLAMLLMYPVGARASPALLRFTDMPPPWRAATALLSPAESPAAFRFRALNYDQLVDSPVELGTFEEAAFEEGRARYRVVVHARPGSYQPPALLSRLKQVVSGAVWWMQDRPFDQYLFIYHFPESGGGAMEHADSAAIEIVSRLANDPVTLPEVTAHEFFHLWNVKRIRPRSLEPVDYTRENYTTALWFSEGVTNTVADYILLHAGLLEEKQYLSRLAAAIRALQSRPAHSLQSAEESSLDTWFDKYPVYHRPERSISYYNKGEILGVLLDLELRRASQGRASLRDLFRRMNQNAKAGKFFDDSAGVRSAAEEITGADFGRFFARYVTGVDELPYDQLFSTVGLRLERRTLTLADPGFRAFRNFDGPMTVVSVEESSDAYRAGVSPGDVLLSLEGKRVERDVNQQVEKLRPGDRIHIVLQGRQGRREVRFKLGARQEEDYQLVEVSGPTPPQLRRRAAWLASEDEPGSDAGHRLDITRSPDHPITRSPGAPGEPGSGSLGWSPDHPIP